MNHKVITDDNIFWKTITTFFTNKGIKKENISLVKDQQILLKSQKISKNLKTFFPDVKKNWAFYNTNTQLLIPST